jgi:Protein of unknown function (DUF3102)
MALPKVFANSDLIAHAENIRVLGRRTCRDVVEIGRLLTAAKKIVGHGHWRAWLRHEFRWTDDTALNFMRVYELSETRNFRDLNLPVSALYALAARGVPDEARDRIFERAKAGEAVSVATVQATIREHRVPQPVQPVRVVQTAQPAPPRRDLVAEAVLLVKRMNEEERRHFFETLRGFDLLEEPEPKSEEPADEILELPRWRH